MLRQPKALAQVQGETFEYLLAGKGRPTILLLNGGDGPIEGWYKILPALCQASATFAYNRAGVGRSTRAAEKQTSDLVVATLRRLLGSLDLRPPYLLVGHSLGGLHANFFARAFPQEVSGLLLLEATAPEDVEAMAVFQSPLQRRLQLLSDFLFDRRAVGEARNASASANLVGAAGPFPDIPVAVISGRAGRMPEAAQRARLHNQQRLSTLSKKGRHVVAERSGHFPQFSEPELVIETVQQLLAEVRGSAGPSS